MTVFGFGTIPVMLITGVGLTFASLTLRRRLMKMAAICVLITGTLTVGRGIVFAANTSAEHLEETCPFCETAGQDEAKMDYEVPAKNQVLKNIAEGIR